MPPELPRCRRCGRTPEPESVGGLCCRCVITGYLVEGDETLRAEFAVMEGPLKSWLANPENRDVAFQQLHDDERARRLQVAGFGNHVFAEPLVRAIDEAVERHGRLLGAMERAVAKLLAASAGKLAGARGAADLSMGLPSDQLKLAVRGIATGRFDAVRAVRVEEVIRLVSFPWCSQLSRRVPRLGEVSAEAVRSALDQAAGGGAPLVAQLNVCVVHAASCIGPEEALELSDLASHAGLTSAELAGMCEEVSGARPIGQILRRGSGVIDVDALNELLAFKRARGWLGFEFDPRLIELIESLGHELAAAKDPWVRWALSSAITGRDAARMSALLADMGEGRRVRASVLAKVRTAGLLRGTDAQSAFRDERAPCSDGGYALEVFSKCFGEELSGRPVPSPLDAWYARARSDYFADASALASLPDVRPVLMSLRGRRDLPDWLEDFVNGLVDYGWREMRRQAEGHRQGWLVDLVEQVTPGRADPRLAERVSSLLTPDRRALLEKLSERALTVGNPPWYLVGRDPQADFCLKEAAFKCGFLGEEEFTRAIQTHSRPIWENPEASAEELKEVKALCQRCGKSMLGRLQGAEVRTRTLEAFRRADWRGMLAAERVEASELPHDSVPAGVLSPLAAVSWAVAATLALFMVGDLLLGGSSATPASPAVPKPVAGTAPWQPVSIDLAAGVWSRLPGRGDAWARRASADELASIIPGAGAAAGGVTRGWAAEFVRRFGASIGGPPSLEDGRPVGGVVATPGGRAIPADKVSFRLPIDKAEADALGGPRESSPWKQSDADISGARRPVVVVLEIPEGLSRE